MKLAICFRRDRTGSTTTVEQMLRAQTLRPEQTSHIFELPQGAVGYVASSERFSSAPLFRQGANGNLLLISGVPICLHGSLNPLLETIREADYRSAVHHVSSLDGAFAAVFWDGLNQRLAIATDFLGLQPLYIVRSKNSILLATELKGIAASDFIGVEMDPLGWASFISFGHFLGGSTSLAGVQRVSPATVLVYDPATGSLEEHTYAHWPKTAAASNIDTECLVQCLRREVVAYADHNRPGTVLLSGGFDSRLILALLKSLGMRPGVLIVSHPWERMDADGRFARRIADRLGLKYDFRIPQPSFFSSDAFVDYLIMNDVATPSLHLFIAQVWPFIHCGMEAVWEGVGPGYSLAFPRIPSAEIQTYVECRCQTRRSPMWRAATRLFANHIAEHMYDDFQQSLNEEISRCPPGDSGLMQFEARHQMRNRMAHNPLKVYSNDVLCFTPGISREFWTLSASIPYSAKWRFKVYLELFRRHFPEALQVPFCSMGQLYATSDRLRPDYWLSYLFPPPGARFLAAFLKRVGMDSWTRSGLVARVVSKVPPEHSDLCADFVRMLQRGNGSGNQLIKNARILLFYWQIWRWVMEGRLRTDRKEVLDSSN